MKHNTKTSVKIPPASKESQAVEALTVGWVLNILLTFVFDLAMWATRWYVISYNPEAKSMVALHFLTFVAGMIAAIACLILTYFVGKMRVEKPPINVTRIAVVVSIVPFILAAINFFSK